MINLFINKHFTTVIYCFNKKQLNCSISWTSSGIIFAMENRKHIFLDNNHNITHIGFAERKYD